jgi:large subunit ribosomal protein L15
MGKRSKRSRLRGRKTAGYGSKKKHRGKGSHGGKGMAGTGKRAGQKLTWVLRYNIGRLGKHGFTSLKQTNIKEREVISLGQISENLESLLKQGIAKKTDDIITLELSGHKILSQGKIEKPIVINAASFSEKAVKKIEKAGGKAIVKE